MTKVRGRFIVEQEGGVWQVVDTKYGTLISFENKTRAQEFATFFRAYTRRHGDINLLSAPWGEESPLCFPPHADPRFDGDGRETYGYRNEPRPEFAAEVAAWFAAHPEEHAAYLKCPTLETQK